MTRLTRDFWELETLTGILRVVGDETVCLVDGFDSICIQTIPGLPGTSDGKVYRWQEWQRRQIYHRSSRGTQVQQGEPGNDGAVVYLELVKIVTETEFVRVPVRVPVFVEVPVFVLAGVKN